MKTAGKIALFLGCALGAVLLVAGFLASLDSLGRRHADSDRLALLEGRLTEAQKAFSAARLEKGKSETKVVEMAALAREHADEIARLRKELGLRKAVMTRRSEATVSWSGTVSSPANAVVTHGPATAAEIPYRFELPWVLFSTPNALGKGGEELTFSDVRERLVVTGLRMKGSVLEAERVQTALYDRDGTPIPLVPTITSYVFEQGLEAPKGPGWWTKIHLDLHGEVGVPYGLAGPPATLGFEPRKAWAGIGAEAQLWGATLGLGASASGTGEIRALGTVGYRWRAF